MTFVIKIAPTMALIAAAWGAICTLCGAYYGLRAAQHRNPNAPYRWLVAANRWQAAWFADQLDHVGLKYRRTAFWFQQRALAFYAIVAIAFVAWDLAVGG